MQYGPSRALRNDAFTILREIAALRVELRELRRVEARRIEDEFALAPALAVELRQDLVNEIAALELRLDDLLAERDRDRATAGLAAYLRYARDGAVSGVRGILRQFTTPWGVVRGAAFVVLPLLALPQLGTRALLVYAMLPALLALTAVAGAVAGPLVPYWGESAWGRAAIGIVAVAPPLAIVNVILVATAPGGPGPSRGVVIVLTAAEALVFGALAGATWPWMDDV